MYIVHVYDDDGVYEYEFGLLDHAREFMRNEKAMAMLTEYKDGNEYLIECKAEKGV